MQVDKLEDGTNSPRKSCQPWIRVRTVEMKSCGQRLQTNDKAGEGVTPIRSRHTYNIQLSLKARGKLTYAKNLAYWVLSVDKWV